MHLSFHTHILDLHIQYTVYIGSYVSDDNCPDPGKPDTAGAAYHQYQRGWG